MNPCAVFDATIVRKYDRPVARSLIFPPLALYRESFGARDYCEQVDLSNGDPIPRHLAVALSLTDVAPPSRGIDCLTYLQREIALKARLFDSDRRVMQLSIEGGALLSREEPLVRLVETLEHYLNIDAEAARVASFDVGSVTLETVMVLRALRFSRLRVVIDTEQSVEQIGRLCAMARDQGVNHIEVVTGGVTDRAGGVLRAILAATPDVVSVSTTPVRGQWPRALGAAAEQLAEGAAQLLAAGYQCVGHRLFARNPGLHNLDTRFYSVDQIGVGPAAISRSGDSYCQSERRLNHYCSSVLSGQLPIRCGLLLTGHNLVRRAVLESLVFQGELDIRALERRHGVIFTRTFAREVTELELMADDGLLSFSRDRIKLRPLGLLLLGAIAHTFGSHLRSNVAWLPLPAKAG